jgi:hypothetical protein
MKPLLFTLSIVSVLSCTSKPGTELTSKQKLEDFDYVYHLFKDYSPFQKENQEFYDIPSIDSVYDFYYDLIKKSDSDTSFIQILQAFIELGGYSGHANILSESEIQFFKQYNSVLGNPLKISRKQFNEAKYWSVVFSSLYYFCNAPFRVKRKEGVYYTANNWVRDGKVVVSENTEILSINGLDCNQFMDSTISSSWFRYYTFNKEWVRDYLFILDEGKSHHGWQVKFNDNGIIKDVYVPKITGGSTPEERENLTCSTISPTIGYIKSRSFAPAYFGKDKRKLKQFFSEHSHQFDTVIIDLRDNHGGDPNYGFNC